MIDLPPHKMPTEGKKQQNIFELMGGCGELLKHANTLERDFKERCRNPFQKRGSEIPVFVARRLLCDLRARLRDSRETALSVLGLQPQEAERLFDLEELEDSWSYEWFRNEDKVTPPEKEETELRMLREKVEQALQQWRLHT